MSLPESLKQRILTLVCTGAAFLAGCRADVAELVQGKGPSESKDDVPPALATSERKSVFAEFASTKSVSESSAHLADSSRPAIRFIDRAESLGVNFVYQNGARGEQLMMEATGGGVGWLDYDRDGWPDLFFGQGGEPWRPAGPDQPRDELFRNRDGTDFENVTTNAGIDDRAYGQGVCVGDYDNDGFADLFITNFGESRLFHNRGDGTFHEVTRESQIHETLWSTSAAWSDIDRDGDLDLYVCRYCQYDVNNPRPCMDKEGRPSICHPQQVDPEPDEFYLNLGDGTFRAAAQELGLYGENNRALGVLIADLNNDRWPEIFVANDTSSNFQFVGTEGNDFVNLATVLGCALSSEGVPQANMGIACADYDRNGYLDLYVTHFSAEWNTLYANDGPAGFSDRTALVGLVAPTMPMLGFGTTMHDFNGDGWLEVFVANGHINDRRTEGSGYAQPLQLFSFNGRSWDDVGKTAGPIFQKSLVGRGVAVGDYDRDGKIDVVCVTHNTPSLILHNESEGARVLQIDCIGRISNRQAFGTRATIHAGGQQYIAEIFGGGSYCSSQELTITFGLDPSIASVDVELVWPSGITQALHNVATPQRITVLEPLDSDSGSSIRTFENRAP
ncbi:MULTISPECIES: CRTAC1 family protein [unclassified Schlesneria]|uniref:CRTAC1 family protein n=1 Tax=Schlesneria TaxID=656899 RepID=UPI002F1EC703